MNSFIQVSFPVEMALKQNLPVVALESAVITHGLPYPHNINLARDMEQVIRVQHVTPATIAVLKGVIKVGITEDELLELGSPEIRTRKISRRDFGIAISRRMSGGTTVCGTMIAASRANIQVFATGGIGGVHRDAPFDVSADLQELAHTPMIVVCAGAKSILDLPATVEVLETLGVPVIGYQTDCFPAFYCRESELPVDCKVENARQAADIAYAHWNAGLKSAILLVIPPPLEAALPYETVEGHIRQAIKEAEKQGIRGAATTPFLLEKMAQLSGGDSLRANLALLKNNAHVAADVARELTRIIHPGRVI